MNREEIAKKLQERGVTLPCSRCGNKTFTVIDGYGNFVLQSEVSGDFVLGGPAVPVALVGCNQCGAITPHALGALGLLPQSEKKEANNG